MDVPVLETGRLRVRPLVMGDLEAVHRLLDVEVWPEGASTREERARWLQWTVLSYGELARLHQPPYGERAIELRETGELIGACGYVPCLNAFGQIPGLGRGGEVRAGLATPEVGLFWAVAPGQQRRGYATEAARALVEHGFAGLRLARIVATTEYDNVASMGVMRRLGMRIERNPLPEPPWLQVVGVLDHPGA